MLGRVSEDAYPLSPMQQGMLFHSLSEPSTGVYVQQKILSLREALDVEVFIAAWQRIVDRHSILRTSFRLSDPRGQVQSVSPHVVVTCEQQDLRAHSELDRQRRMCEFLTADRRRGFDFEAGPPMRLALFRLGDAAYEFVWTSHHALLDGRSYVIVLSEVFQVYEALRSGRNCELPDPRPYREFVEWYTGRDWTEADHYWRNTLARFETATPLVIDQTLPADPQADAFQKVEVTLSESKTSRLRSAADSNEFTVNNVVQGAWALLLNRYSSQRDVLFGTTRAGRSSLPEGRDRVGLFINTVPFAVTIEPEMTVREFLTGIRRQHVTLRDHEMTPLSMIQRWSRFSRPPLFESVLVFENSLVDSALRSQGAGWENRDFRLLEQTNYPLTVGAYFDRSLILKIGYDTRRFDRSAITRMLGHLETLILGMIDDLEGSLRDLPLLTKEEEHQVLVEWNRTETDFPKDSTLHGLFERQVLRTPDNVAVIADDGRLTYRELNRRANQLARRLHESRVSGRIVGIYMERSLEMVVGLLGTLKAGAAYLPLDPSYPRERINYMLSDSQVPVVVTQKRLAANLPDHNALAVCCDLEDFPTEDGPIDFTFPSRGTPDDLAYVIYTSGSTGRPKGVMIEHRAICNHMHWMQAAFRLSPSDRVLQKTPFSFDASVWEFYAPLMCGATLVMARPGGHQESAYLVQAVIDQEITILQLVPTILEHLLEEPSLSAATSLKRVFCGGEALTQEVVSRFFRLLSVPLINLYGPTEASIDATSWMCEPLSVSASVSSVPIGRPVANMQAYVVDSSRRPLPVGVPGELCLGGAGLARGYLNQPQLTAEKFVNLPFLAEDRARVYLTGDQVVWRSDGTLSYRGRMDSQVKYRGFRIELGEIENVLNACGGIHRSVVLVREDSSSNPRLVAYIVPQPDSPPDMDELRRALQDVLPNYMVPTAYVMLDSIPLLPNGKVDRKSLPQPEAVQERREETVPPRDETEAQLVRIWEEILQQRPISIDDNFFDLGGDSLLAMRLLIQIKKQFPDRLSEMSIYQSPTVAMLTRSLRQTPEDGRAEGSVIVPIHAGGRLPPFFLAGLAAGPLVR
ncbi:MAG: amino acid adenylation domain-containing protein, partial [Planctomycetaceae bacterium]